MSCNTVSIFPKVQSHYVSKILISQILNCGVGKDSWECLGLQGDRPWIFIGRTDADSETLILWLPDMKSWLIWKDPDAGKDWRWEEKGREWDGWMASLTQWTWVWVNSGSWWWTGKPGVLQSMELQRVGHNWATELNWMQERQETKVQSLGQQAPLE